MKKTYRQIIKYQQRLKEPLNKTNFSYINIFSVSASTVLVLALQFFIKGLVARELIFMAIYIVLSCNLINIFRYIYYYKYDKVVRPIITMIITILYTYFIIEFTKETLIASVVLSYPVMYFNKKTKMKKLRSLNLFEKDGLRGANLLVKDLVPFQSFENLITINVTLKEEIYGKDMEIFNDKLAYYCHKNKLLFMGFKYEKYKLSYKTYLYANKYNLDKLNKFLKDNLNYKFDIKIVKDKKYEYYLNHICPDDKLFMHMCNNNIINNKIPDTVNLYEEQSIILVLAFEHKENALKCFKELKESGEYEQIDYDDNSKHVSENNLNKIYTNMIYIEQKTRIGLSKLNMITDYMYDIAKKYNGSFEEWGIGELTKEED